MTSQRWFRLKLRKKYFYLLLIRGEILEKLPHTESLEINVVINLEFPHVFFIIKGEQILP